MVWDDTQFWRAYQKAKSLGSNDAPAARRAGRPLSPRRPTGEIIDLDGVGRGPAQRHSLGRDAFSSRLAAAMAVLLLTNPLQILTVSRIAALYIVCACLVVISVSIWQRHQRRNWTVANRASGTPLSTSRRIGSTNGWPIRLFLVAVLSSAVFCGVFWQLHMPFRFYE